MPLGRISYAPAGLEGRNCVQTSYGSGDFHSDFAGDFLRITANRYAYRNFDPVDDRCT